MDWTELDTWIVVTGALVSMACAIPGVFLLLNKQSMLGDAISHAVLPGLAIGYLVSGTREIAPMLAGAVAAGVLTGFLTGVIRRSGRVEGGAALGVVFCSLFALGLVLIRLAADRIDLDPGCVLYGSLETAVVDAAVVPSIAIHSAGILAVNLGLVAIFYKELRVVAFDPAFAASLGLPVRAFEYGLAMVTAVTTVIAFESVGSILVIAMLIVPGATALLVTHRLGLVLAMSLAFAAAAALFGHLAAIGILPQLLSLGTGSVEIGAVSSAGMMATCGGILFVVVLCSVRIRERIQSQEPQAGEGSIAGA